MQYVKGEIMVGVPVEVVFDFVADERNEPLYNPQIVKVEKLTEGPIAVGTRFAATTRTGGRSIDMLLEVTGYDRPTHLSTSASLSTMDIQGSLRFEPVGNGTLMRWSWELRPKGALKLLGPLIGLMGRRNERAIWASLKHYLESA